MGTGSTGVAYICGGQRFVLGLVCWQDEEGVVPSHEPGAR